MKIGDVVVINNSYGEGFFGDNFYHGKIAIIISIRDYETEYKYALKLIYSGQVLSRIMETEIDLLSGFCICKNCGGKGIKLKGER